MISHHFWPKFIPAIDVYQGEHPGVLATFLKVGKWGHRIDCSKKASKGMPAKYNTRHLTKKEVALTFPLIQALYGEATLPEWSDFAFAQIGKKSCEKGPATPDVKGIIVAENQHGYIQGLFYYSLNTDTFLGPTLICDQFIAFDLVGVDSPYLALLEEAESIARRHGSVRLDLHVPKGLLPPAATHSRLHALLHESGHEANSLRYCKSLTQGESS